MTKRHILMVSYMFASDIYQTSALLVSFVGLKSARGAVLAEVRTPQGVNETRPRHLRP